MKYVIIGGSAAALSCIEGIRSRDAESEITLVSREAYPFYGRPLISYLLEGKTTLEKVLRYRSPDYEAEMGIQALRGQEALSIDTREHVISTSQRLLPYDKLCLATGSTPFVPPMEGLDNVQNKTSFYTLDDALRLQSMLKNGGRVLIIGAGLIGLKCAEGIRGMADSIDVVDLAPRILPTVLPEEPAGIVLRHLRTAGIRFHLSTSVARFTRDTAWLQDGHEIPFDVLVLAVGVRPNVSLASTADLQVERGIWVDDHGRTSDPDIYAAGDCTAGSDSDGVHRVLAIWPNAMMQGRCAGINMAGGDAAEAGIPMNATGFMGLHLISAGRYDGELLLTHTPEMYKALYVRDDRLVGYILLGNVERAGIYTALVRDRTKLSSIDFELIRESPQLMAFSATERAQKLGGEVL